MDPQTLLPASIMIAWATYFMGVASPGPSVLATMSVAMSAGRRAALIFASGVISGSFVWALAATLGISALIVAYPPLIAAIKIAGGLYLLWLGYRAGRAAWATRHPAMAAASPATPVLGRLYLRGLLMHLTNPKALLVWMSIVVMGAPADRSPAPLHDAATTASASQTWLLTAGCMAIAVTVFVAYALLFSTARIRRLYSACRMWLEILLCVMFVIAGATLLNTAR